MVLKLDLFYLVVLKSILLLQKLCAGSVKTNMDEKLAERLSRVLDSCAL